MKRAGAVGSLLVLGAACHIVGVDDTVAYRCVDGGCLADRICVEDHCVKPGGGSGTGGGSAGGTGGGSAADAGLCAGAAHWACDDFDRDGAVDDPLYWDTELVDGDGGIVFTTVSVHSRPNAAEMFSGDGANVALLQHGGPTAGYLSCSFWLQLADAPAGAGVNVATLGLFGGTGTYTRIDMAVLLRPIGDPRPALVTTYAYLPDAGVMAFSPELVPVGRNEWHHLTLGIRSGSLIVEANGTQTASPLPPLASADQFTSATLQVGLALNTVVSGIRTRIDDVVCDLR